MPFFKRCVKRFHGWTNTSAKTIGAAALIISLAGIISRILGFVRDRLLASQFGAGDVLDAYYAAFRIPDLLYNLLVMGALSAAFVPIFTDLLATKKKEAAWKLAVSLLEWMIMILGILSLLMFMAAPWIISILVPGFSEEKQMIAVDLTRIMLLSPMILATSAVFGSVLVSFRRFIAYSFAPIFYNLGIIFGIVALVPNVGVTGLGWGVVLGAFLHMAVQVPAVYFSGFPLRLLRFRFHYDGTVHKVLLLMIPRSLGMATNQIGLLLTTVFASALASGSLAVFTLASNIQSIPIGLFAVAFSLAAFPMLSLSVSRGKEQEFFSLLAGTAKRILFFVVPLSMLFIVFRAQFVRVILGSGQFDWEDTIATFGVLAWLSVSLFAQGLIPLFARGFYALQDTKTPLYVALAAEVFHIISLILLLPYYSVDALAISFSIGSIVNFFLLLVFLRRRILSWKDREIFSESMKIFLAALFAGVVAQFSKSAFILAPSPLDTFAEIFLQLVFGVSLSLTAFLLASSWLRIEEFHLIKRWVRCKVLREPAIASNVEGHPEKGEW